MSRLTNKHIQHLYWRAGFGISYTELHQVKKMSKNKIIQHLFDQSKDPKELHIDLKEFEKDPKTLTKEKRKELRNLQNQKILDMNALWFEQMKNTKGVLREKMTLFFQNHFAVRLRMPKVMLYFHNTIRKHALSNFGELLMDISRSPAMIMFLNNRQNRKGSPNENFAREVMELFTLGRDNRYTEKDIKEAARAFTGWDFDKEGKFVFRQYRHDSGDKVFLERKGAFKGEDIIKILLEEKQTAIYLTEKIYRFFVHDTINQEHIKELATIFYDSNYNIEILLKSIFSSTWFYDKKNIGTKIKSPVDLITGLNRQFYITYAEPKVLFYTQRKLNQMLFYPPNVAGWPGGKYWIDSSTMMIRLKLASVMLTNGKIDMDIKQDMPENMMTNPRKSKRTGLAKRIRAQGNWKKFLVTLQTENKKEVTDFLIQPELSEAAKRVLSASGINDTKSFIVELLSLPEYQLC